MITLVEIPLYHWICQGRRLGLLDVKFEDDPEMFTDSQNKLFGIEMKQMKVSSNFIC